MTARRDEFSDAASTLVTPGATAAVNEEISVAHEAWDGPYDAQNLDRLLEDVAGTLRRFARIEAESASILRRSADTTRDPEAARRRRRVAAEAEERWLIASRRASRIERDLLESNLRRHRWT